MDGLNSDRKPNLNDRNGEIRCVAEMAVLCGRDNAAWAKRTKRMSEKSAWLSCSIIPSMSASGKGVQAGDHVRSLDCRLRLCGCVVASNLQMKLHDMLVAGAAPNTKGVRQNCPLTSGSFLADQNSGPLPFFASLRLRCVQVLGPCPLTIIATSNDGAKQ